jgi:hypothetical protein
MMGIFASGMNSSGWAFVVSAGKRYADEGYFEGTTLRWNSLLSVEKELNDSHLSISLDFILQTVEGKIRQIALR